MEKVWNSTEVVWSVAEVTSKRICINENNPFGTEVREIRTRQPEDIPDESMALDIAKRLAEKEPGRFFLVMKSTHVVVAPALPPEKTALVPEEEMDVKQPTEARGVQYAAPLANEIPDA